MGFYIDRISVMEGSDTETYEDNHKFINESLSKGCNGCHVLFYIKKNFHYNELTCDRCYKILLNTVFECKNIYFIWWNNCKYRVSTSLECEQAQRLMKEGKTQDRYGYIDLKKLEKFEKLE